MITYIIKFIICSGLLLLVYRAFLGNERLYKFNRFYLLFSLVFSLAVPFVTISVPAVKMPYFDKLINQTPPAQVETIQQKATAQQVTDQAIPGIIDDRIEQETAAFPEPVNVSAQPVTIQAPPHNYLPQILLGIYAIISAFFLVRFAKNSWHISYLIAKSTIVTNDDTKLVLINEDVTPHSFLNYVFVNKDAYQNGELEPEIICHEQTHIRQMHSLDVIFIELLQVVCWFNPFIPFYRKSIQLNHEFLADEAVIENYDNTPAYQYLLLAKVSQAASLNLTSQFNYLATKKRLLMMTKHTSAKIGLYKRLAVVPFLAIAIFLFSQKSTAEILKGDKHTNIRGANSSIKETEIISEKDKKPSSKFLIPSDSLNEAKAMQMIKKFPRFGGGRVRHADKDAPVEVMNAYKAILDKYDIRLMDDNGKGKLPDISSADTAQLHKLFSQMSIKQQDNQFVWFQPAWKPLPKNKVTAGQLKLYSGDAKKYGVWIDSKRIKNSDLANYKPEDFSHIFFSRLMPNAIKNDGFRFQVGLTTNKAYDADYKKIMADQGDKLTRVYVRKNQLRVTSDKTSNKVRPPKSAMNNVGKPQFHIVTVQEWKNIMGVGLNLHQRAKDIGIPIQNLKNVKVFISKLNKEYGSDYRLITMPEFEYFVRKHPSVKILKDKLLIIQGYISKDEESQAYKFPPPIVYPDIPTAKQDAPQNVMNEYAAILSKYTFKNGFPVPQLGARTIFSEADMNRLEVLFKQMSKAQQQQQTVAFRPPWPPLAKSYPTKEMFSDWQAKKYGIWINYKRVTYAELAKYKAADFDHYHVNKFKASIEINGGIAGEVDLMTKDYYKIYRINALADTSWQLTFRKKQTAPPATI
jgi:bla regulator protein BlaR1